MNIAGASLYNAFGDKRSLYERSLNRYLDQTFRERIQRIEPSLPPRDAIIAFLHEIIKRSVTDKQRRGCLLVNSAIESAPHDPKFLDIVATFLSQVEAFFLRCVSKGQGDGTISRAHSAADLSKSLLGILLGIRVLARVRPERKLLEGLVRPVFGLLDGSDAAPAVERDVRPVKLRRRSQ
jgi:TetR/AcrR family transcriptional repressor of nem operon